MNSIRWHRRMEARVAAGVILLVAISLLAIILGATRVAMRSAMTRASNDLEDARDAFYRLVDDRASTAAQQTRLITTLPVFRSAMINPVVAGDVATLTQMADAYRQDLGAQFAILTTPEGTPTALPGWPTGAPLPAGLQAAISGAASGASRRDIVPVDGRLFLVTSEPATFAQSELLGTVTFGFPLDNGLADHLAQITHADINFVSSNRLAGSSLSGAEQREVAARLSAGDLTQVIGIAGSRQTIGTKQFIEGTFPLFRGSEGSAAVGHLVLLQDWAPNQQFIDELRRSLLVAGAITFLLTLAGGLIFSRSTSRPMMDMAVAARDIAEGDWTRAVPVGGSAEATTLAVALNDMTRSLRDHAEQLKASYERFFTVTQSARDAIVSADDAGRITFWNKSAEATFGYAEHEIVGQPITKLVAEDDRAAYTAALPKPALNDLTFGSIVELKAVRQDGGTFPGEFSLAANHGAAGMAFTAVVRDVTERKQAQATLQQRDEQLRQAQKMEAIGRLAGGVAHDFNNLLMAIHGYAEMLVSSLEGDPRREDADEIVKAADRAAGLTRQLLAFSRRQVIKQQAIELDKLVENMRNMLQRLIGADVRIDTDVWPDLMPVLADSTQVEQILVNLVVNARDAMPSGGLISIELRNIELDKVGVAAHPGLQPGDYVEMAVSDSGSGMDSETASHIFEPFFTTKERGKGTGLGLSTVYGIVQQSGGAIEVQSRVGHGTTFYIYLPCATDFGKPARMKPPAAKAISETVLLVEDDDRVRALISNMLKKQGYSVLLASAADQAMEIAARHRGSIHLLLTDVVMPGASGRHLSERLTAERPETRVLFMSGYSDDAILRHGVKQAAAHFIQKPFSVDALAHRIRDILATPRAM